MSRHNRKKKPPVPHESSDPHTMAYLLSDYLEWMKTAHYAERTIANRKITLGYFICWCEDRGIMRPHEVTLPILERYQRRTYHYRKENNQPLSFRTQYERLAAVRAFLKWLAKNRYILYNPAAELTLPRLEKRLPRYVLTAQEAETIINQPDIFDPLGIRDRAILETLYSTGIRRMELIALTLYDLDQERGTIMIAQGKGRKDRMVPIGERAIAWIKKYLTDVRPHLALAPDTTSLFLTSRGEPLSPNRLSDMVGRYITKAGIKKHGACHLFRHTTATLMLENGADIRFIQQMLGHAQLTTTQIYTHVSIRKLKEIHTATHPSALMQRKEKR